MGGNAKLFADRLGQSFDDMDLIAELLRVKCGFLDAMRFRQAEHIDSRDFGGISSAGKGHCVPGVVDRLRSMRRAAIAGCSCAFGVPALPCTGQVSTKSG